MNIHKSRGDRVIVELSSNELSRYELCPEEMDCKNPKTRRLINDVMKRAQRHIRRDITSFDKMNVDVMETDEGCIMILCFKGIKTKRPFSGYVCVLPQTDDIFRLARGLLPHREKIRQASLFFDGNSYAACVLPYAVFSREIFFCTQRIREPGEGVCRHKRVPFRAQKAYKPRFYIVADLLKSAMVFFMSSLPKSALPETNALAPAFAATEIVSLFIPPSTSMSMSLSPRRSISFLTAVTLGIISSIKL